MADVKKNFWLVLFYGATWGLIEATLGHLLHFITTLTFVPVSGLIMFPIGFYLMMRAFKETNSTATIFQVGAVAASIKLFDFLAPFLPPEHVLHPATAILLEASAVFAFVKISKTATILNRFATATAVSLAWRLCFLTVLATGTDSRGVLEKGVIGLSLFLIIEPLINGLLIIKVVSLINKFSNLSCVAIRPAFVCGIYTIAVLSQLASRLVL